MVPRWWPRGKEFDMAAVIGFPVKVEGLVARKTSYEQKDSGKMRYLAEVAGIGWQVPVFFDAPAEFEACPPEGSPVILTGKFGPYQNGLFRLQDARIEPKK
jgi:hypothetical protein